MLMALCVTIIYYVGKIWRGKHWPMSAKTDAKIKLLVGFLKVREWNSICFFPVPNFPM